MGGNVSSSLDAWLKPHFFFGNDSTKNRIHPIVWKIDAKCYIHEPIWLYLYYTFPYFRCNLGIGFPPPAPAVDVVLTTRVPPEHRSGDAAVLGCRGIIPPPRYLGEWVLKLEIIPGFINEPSLKRQNGNTGFYGYSRHLRARFHPRGRWNTLAFSGIVRPSQWWFWFWPWPSTQRRNAKPRI